MAEHTSGYIEFYDTRRDQTYANDYQQVHDRHYNELKSFVERFRLKDKKCLEIGSAAGFFQDMVDDYWGTDVAESLSQYYHKPYKVAKGSKYPFADESFDAIWTFAVYEHIPELQTAMLEIKRLLKPGGVVIFRPAWQCRPWTANGYAVRPYKDLNWKGKLIKASIPIRENLLYRSIFIFPKRVFRHLLFLIGYRYTQLRYKQLEANYETFWQPDADACNSIEPHDAILWFLSHGFDCISCPTHLSAFLVRTGRLEFIKK